MMFAENRKISIRQLQMLLLLDCFGTAVLFLPAELAEISGRGCFFAALLGGLGVSAAWHDFHSMPECAAWSLQH